MTDAETIRLLRAALDAAHEPVRVAQWYAMHKSNDAESGRIQDAVRRFCEARDRAKGKPSAQ